MIYQPRVFVQRPPVMVGDYIQVRDRGVRKSFAGFVVSTELFRIEIEDSKGERWRLTLIDPHTPYLSLIDWLPGENLLFYRAWQVGRLSAGDLPYFVRRIVYP